MTVEEMMVAIGDSQSNRASSDHGQDGEDEDDKGTEQCKLSKDDEPGWVMGTCTNKIHCRMEKFRQKQMKRNELTLPGWEDAAAYFGETEKKYGPSRFSVPAVIQPRTDDDAAPPAPAMFVYLMECLGIVPRLLQMLQGTSQPGSNHTKLGSVGPQLNISIRSWARCRAQFNTFGKCEAC